MSSIPSLGQKMLLQNLFGIKHTVSSVSYAGYICATPAPDINLVAKYIEIYNTAWFQCRSTKQGHISHLHNISVQPGLVRHWFGFATSAATW